MHRIRHYIVLLAGLALIVVLGGAGAAIVAAAAVAVSAAAQGLSRMVLAADMRRSRSGAAGSILALTVIRLLALAAGAVLLLLRSGWAPALVYVVAVLASIALTEDEFGRARREAITVRTELCALIDAGSAGRVTQDQLTTRAARLLRTDLPHHAYGIKSVSAALISSDGLSPAKHRKLLELLERHLTEAERFRGLPSHLHREVRAGLGRS
ncbi:hypothetical protein ACRAWF_25805 [Streptomyces sp. L7]